MDILKYKNVAINDVLIDPPVKNGGEISSKIYYKVVGKELFIQTPLIYLKDTSILTFPLEKQGLFFTSLVEISEKLCNTIYDKSIEFFNGKCFSFDRITRSLTSLAEMTEEVEEGTEEPSSSVWGRVGGEIILDDNIKITDTFGDRVSVLDIPKMAKCWCILKINRLIFKGKCITPEILITHIKISVTPKKAESVRKSIFKGVHQRTVKVGDPIYEEAGLVEGDTEVEDIVSVIPIEDETPFFDN